MKQTVTTIACCIVATCSFSQQGLSSYKQPSSSSIAPKLQIATNAAIANKIQVSENGGTFNSFDTERKADGWLYTKTPVYVQTQAAGQKRFFLKTFVAQGNTGMWVVRIVRAFDNNNVELLRPLTHDSTFFPNVLANVQVPPLKLMWAPSFTISAISYETLTVDSENQGAFKDNAEYVGTLNMAAYKLNGTGKSLIKNLGYIFSVQGNQNSSAYKIMKLGEVVQAPNNPSFTFSVPEADFDNCILAIVGSLYDIDPTNPTESNRKATDKVLQKEGQSTNMKLADMWPGKNAIDIQGDGRKFRVHFSIKAN